MSDRPDLTVIVVTHNRPELALATLRSARRAAGQLAVEWIVVDSGSTDGTAEAVRAEWPDMRVVPCANIGYAAGNNRGLTLARGRYLLLLNPDVEIVHGTFAELIAELDRRSEIGLASVIHRDPDGSLQYSIRRYPSPLRAFGEAVAAPRWTPWRGLREEEVRVERYARSQTADWLVGAFLIARSEAVEEVGGLGERFFLYSEEIDWCYRFRDAGWDVRHLPLMEMVHHHGDISHRADLSAQLSYAKLLFARKHYGRGSAGAIRAALALRHALRAAAAALLRGRPDWRARSGAERHALRVLAGAAEPPFGQAETGAKFG